MNCSVCCQEVISNATHHLNRLESLFSSCYMNVYSELVIIHEVLVHFSLPFVIITSTTEITQQQPAEWHHAYTNNAKELLVSLGTFIHTRLQWLFSPDFSPYYNKGKSALHIKHYSWCLVQLHKPSPNFSVASQMLLFSISYADKKGL